MSTLAFKSQYPIFIKSKLTHFSCLLHTDTPPASGLYVHGLISNLTRAIDPSKNFPSIVCPISKPHTRGSTPHPGNVKKKTF